MNPTMTSYGSNSRPRARNAARFAMLTLALALAAAVMVPPAALAVQPDEVLSDSVLEARARAISHGLRCLVCQNQSIDDSDAPLARDLRLLVRERLVAGDSDAQVTGFLVARYGDFVLLKPPFKGSTLILWILPLLLFSGGIAYAMRKARSQAAAAKTPPLTADEERALSELMKTPEGPGRSSKGL